MSGTVVRAATREDAEGIARVQIDGWRFAYRGLVPRRLLDTMDLAERTARWEQLVAGRHVIPGGRDLVAVRDGEVCGFACVGPVRQQDGYPTDATGELYALYAAPRSVGTGVGRALMQEGVALLRGDGHAAAVLWVFRGNARARGFYERMGWDLEGADHAMDALAAPQVRYRRDL
ncbi:MAG: GNAT family N-acetyltransferase [Thermoleophilia bacterium]